LERTRTGVGGEQRLAMVIASGKREKRESREREKREEEESLHQFTFPTSHANWSGVT
jgi:hypothetical protein